MTEQHTQQSRNRRKKARACLVCRTRNPQLKNSLWIYARELAGGVEFLFCIWKQQQQPEFNAKNGKILKEGRTTTFFFGFCLSPKNAGNVSTKTFCSARKHSSLFEIRRQITPSDVILKSSFAYEKLVKWHQNHRRKKGGRGSPRIDDPIFLVGCSFLKTK